MGPRREFQRFCGGSVSMKALRRELQRLRRELHQAVRRKVQHLLAVAGALVLQALRRKLQSRERRGESCAAEGARPLFTVHCPSDASALRQAFRKERPWSAHATGSAGGGKYYQVKYYLHNIQARG